MQVIENWATINGRVKDLQVHPALAGYACVRVEVSGVSPVGGYANLFAWAVGQTIAVNVPAQCQGKRLPGPGEAVSWRVRKGGPEAVFIDPDSLAAA